MLATLVLKFWILVLMAVTMSPRVVAMLPILPPTHVNAGKKFRTLILSSPPGKHSDDRLEYI